MKLKEYSKEELETMSYDEIAYIVLQESGKKMKLLDIFKKVAKAVNMSDEEVENRIADFFELMSINKKFVMLDKGFWDLSNKHMKSVIVEDEEEVELDDSDDIDSVIEDEEEEDEIFYSKEEEDADDEDDDLSGLVVIDPDEEETSL